MRHRDTILAWLLPVVLIVVALNQIHLASTRDLTPWKGGGFGMFASIDRSTYRAVQMTFVTPGGEFAVDIHEFHDLTRRSQKAYVNARALPDERRVGHLLDVVEDAEWVLRRDIAEFSRWLDAGEVGPQLRASPDGPELRVGTITVEVWAPRYERGDDLLVPEKLARHEHRLWASG